MPIQPSLQKAALIALLLSPFVLNDRLTAASSETENYQEYSPDFICHSPYRPMYLGIRHIEARGVGYNEGYSTLEGFGIYDGVPSFMPFLDLRGHVFNSGRLAGSIGFGERSMIPSTNYILGMYLYYDVRQENHHLDTVNQLSPGIEVLGKRMEYRLNGYFPMGKDKSRPYGYKYGQLGGNRVLLKYYRKYALEGADAEVGVHITQSTKYDIFTGAGPYYFTSSHDTSWGGKVRLLGRYKQYISLEASYSYDNMFKSVVQGSISLNCPFGGKLKRRDSDCCPQKNDLALSRAAFAPYRFEIPVVKRHTFRPGATL